ncbi:MAG: MFS transporter [Candidatus Margulisiibacteriota bacterium]
MRAFESLQFKNYRDFWTGQLVSLTGSWMQMIAMGWLVYDLTSSKLLLGLINGIAGIPVLLLMPIGGIFADRMSKRKLMLFTQISFAALAFTIGLLISTGHISFWNLAAIAFLMGIINAIDVPANQAFVVELVDRRVLGNAIALNSIAFNIARVIGPAVAGYMIGLAGIEACFYLNALSFFVLIFVLLHMKGDFSPKADLSKSMGYALSEGIRYILDNKKVLFSISLVAFTSLFIMPYAALMPVFAKDILKVGAPGMGILMSFAGIGALIGAFMLAQYSAKIDLKTLILTSTLTLSATAIVFSVSTVFSFSCLMLMIMGWAVVSQAASINTFIQKEVPNELRGRVMSFFSLFFLGFMPIGAFQAGIVAHFLGAPAALIIGGLICLIPAVPMALYLKK